MRAQRPLRMAAWGCVALVAIVSLLPVDDLARTGMGASPEHGLAYAGTAFLMGLAYPRHQPWRSVALLSLYAGVLELLQGFSPGRHPGVEGWLASSAGAALGAWGVHLGLALIGARPWRLPGSDSG